MSLDTFPSRPFKTLTDLEKVPGFSHAKVSKLSKELSVAEDNKMGTTEKTPATPKQK